MRRIDSSDLQIGMYVAELDRPWLETPFMFQGFVIQDENELKELQRLCQYVYIHEAESHHAVASQTVSAKARLSGERHTEHQHKAAHKLPVEDEIRAARKIRQRAIENFMDMSKSARLGKGVDTKLANKIVGDMVESVLRNPDALLLLRNLGNHDAEAESHAISVSILSLTLGRYLNMPNFELKELGLAALLHDIGETQVPLDILREGPKNERETALYNRHTELGANILMEHGTLSERVIDVALSHHEQINGDGYPTG